MCDCKKTCCKILISLVIILAVVLAATVAYISGTGKQQALIYVVYISRFFDVMLPVLAVGALLKYLLCHRGCCCHDKKDNSCCK